MRCRRRLHALSYARHGSSTLLETRNASSTAFARREVFVKVCQGKLTRSWMQYSMRLVAIATVSISLPALVAAQSTMPAFVATDDGQASSQAVGATLEGTVADNKGGLIGAATIVVHNDATGRVKTATADAMGHFSIAGLPVGTYTIDAS